MRGICGKQYVVEADGSVYPCDFYVIDSCRLGNFCKDSVEQIDQVRERIGFIKESQQKEIACSNWKYEALCRGGCRRTRQAERGHHQYFCRSYQMFFEACLPRMLEIAKRISSV